jgi:hypothetical protein
LRAPPLLQQSGRRARCQRASAAADAAAQPRASWLALALPARVISSDASRRIAYAEFRHRRHAARRHYAIATPLARSIRGAMLRDRFRQPLPFSAAAAIRFRLIFFADTPLPFLSPLLHFRLPMTPLRCYYAAFLAAISSSMLMPPLRCRFFAADYFRFAAACPPLIHLRHAAWR